MVAIPFILRQKDACKMYVKIFTNECKKEEFKILKLDFVK